MTARNITLSLPSELIREAKVLAAERETSVSALVADLLGELVGRRSDYGQLWADEEAMMGAGALRVGPVTWARDDLHRR